MKKLVITEIVLCLAGLAGLMAFNRYSRVAERAAYLEGRFGLDHDTAMVYAQRDLGR